MRRGQDVLGDSIDGSEDWYHLRLIDSDITAGEWDLWLNGDIDSVDESVILPGLDPGIGTAPPVVDSPLLIGPGITWTQSVEAFNLDSAMFPSTNGRFFAALFRDCETWSASVPGAPFNVQ